MKRLTIILMIILLMTSCHGSADQAPIQPKSHNHMTYSLTHKSIPKMYLIGPLTDVSLQAKAAFLINYATGDILFNKNADQSLPIASMSKIMTELIVLEAIETGTIHWDDTVSISDYAYTISNQPGYASVQLEKNKKYTVKELFHAMAIQSANGATIALAEAVSGNERNFITLMNDKAKQLQLNDTHFVNSTGLTNKDLLTYHSLGSLEDSNKMSAKNLATLVKYVITHYPDLLNITKTISFDFNGKTYFNSNWMLPGTEIDWIDTDITFPGVDGLKTGFTDDAGYGFAGTVEMNDIRFISVIIGTKDLEDRFIETKVLYDAILEQINDK